MASFFKKVLIVVFSLFKFQQQQNNEQEKNKTQKKNNKPSSPSNKKKSQTPMDSSLSVNLDYIKKKTGNSPDIVVRRLRAGGNSEIQTAVVYVKGLVNNAFINDFLIESMMKHSDLHNNLDRQKILEMVPEEIVALGSVKRENDWDKLFESMLTGNTAIFIDGVGEALIASTQGGSRRSVQESGSNISVRGPREGFVESAETNLAMVRRIINNPDLWTESMTLGKMTKTNVSIMYINGLARKDILEEVRKRLKQIDIDSILDSGYVEQLIEDNPRSPFPTIYNTDRPDVVAGNLLEGRVAIFVNGTPFVLLAPAVFIQFFQATEDYYSRFDISSAIRFLRVSVFLISLLGPAIYIGATTFHPELIPTQLLIIVAAQRESVPFPAVVEAFLMEVTFEILREAGIRMPKAIGATVSIVGGLVIGQAAVQAGIVSPAMVIVVAVTAISSFATPAYSVAISVRLLRFIFMISAAMFGFYGMLLAFFILLIHLCSLRSFGVPYMSPLAPINLEGMGDTVYRRPLWKLKHRPSFIAAKNIIREGENQRPAAPEGRLMSRESEKGDENES